MDLETLLKMLINLESVFQTSGKDFLIIDDLGMHRENVQGLIRLLKKYLYDSCKKLPISNSSNNHDPFEIHSNFFKKLLLRPSSLPRIRMFTINYDLIIEKTLDALGVSYFDGFSGTVNRIIHTESYNYDLYYPGETTEGKVERVDRVLHLYKLHGSINWLRVESSGSNIWGIQQRTPEENQYGDLMIYPSPLKEGEILGYPYSESFRHFSFSINRSQSVLFTIGYSFNDSHINQLIYKSFSIPSFTLVIVTPELVEDENNEIFRLYKRIRGERIIIITGAEKTNGEYVNGAGTFQGFTNEWMPDIKELDTQKKIKIELDNLLGKNDSNLKVNEENDF